MHVISFNHPSCLLKWVHVISSERLGHLGRITQLISNQTANPAVWLPCHEWGTLGGGPRLMSHFGFAWKLSCVTGGQSLFFWFSHLNHEQGSHHLSDFDWPLAVPDLRCCVPAFSGCGERGIFVWCTSFSLRWLLLWGTGSRHTGLSSCSMQAQ